MPVGGLDVDVSEKTGNASEILAALAVGRYEPAKDVVVESPRGLFPTRIARQSDGSVQLHFDQRPRITAKKLILKFRGRLERVDLSADGTHANVIISGLPDLEIRL